jgi:Holliday junction resolvase RusA-like endonuclease
VPIFPLAEGDVDNFDKFVLDGLQGVLYSDDRAVITLRSHKRYADNQVGNTTIVVKRIQQ